MSFISQLMEPGGGVLLLPFVRVVISLLLILTLGAAFVDVARIHMIVLSFLSSGLLVSLWFFEKEFNKAKGKSSRSSSSNATGVPSQKTQAGKTD